jgi:hypothetical protein
MSNLYVRDKGDITPDAAWYALPAEYRSGELGHQVSSELAEIGHNPHALMRYLHGMGVEVVQLREDVNALDRRVAQLEQRGFSVQPVRGFPSRHAAGDGNFMAWVTSLNMTVASFLLVIAGMLCCTIYIVRLASPVYVVPVEVQSR